MTKMVFVEKSREAGEEFVEISKGMLKSQNYAIAIEGKKCTFYDNRGRALYSSYSEPKMFDYCYGFITN